MRKGLVTFFLLIFFASLAWFGYTSIEKFRQKRHWKSDLISAHRLGEKLGFVPPDGDFIVVYFSGECEHCQWQMGEIENSLGPIEDAKMLLVSLDDQEQAFPFLRQYSLEAFYHPTRSDQIVNTFSGGVPQLLIYKDAKLVKHFRGETKMEAVLPYFQ